MFGHCAFGPNVTPAWEKNSHRENIFFPSKSGNRLTMESTSSFWILRCAGNKQPLPVEAFLLINHPEATVTCLVNELMKSLGPCIDPLLRSFLWSWNMPLIYELTLTWQMRNTRGRKEPVLQKSRVYQSSLNFWKSFTWTFTSLADRNIIKRIIFLLLQNLNKAGLVFVMLHFTPRQWCFIEGFPHPLLWLETALNWATEVFEFCVNISV